MYFIDKRLSQFHYAFSEKSHLHRTIEKLTSELQEMKEKYEELREARQDTVRELLSIQDQHQEEVRLIRADLQDETNSREGMDRRINDLRTEVRFGLFLSLYIINC